jgi:hypothetical protein
MLHGPLKREFLIEQGWIPLEESPEGLVVMCMSTLRRCVAPASCRRFFRVRPSSPTAVTTLTEFEETSVQLYGAGAEGGTIDQLLADLSAPIDDGSNDDSL